MDRFKAGEGHGPVRASPSLEPSGVSGPRWRATSGLQPSISSKVPGTCHSAPLTHSPSSHAGLSPSVVFRSPSSLVDPV